MHQDIFSKKDDRTPIVSISIGLSADFTLRKDWGKKHKLHTVVLGSGDAFVFGGASRGILHGIGRVHPHLGNGGPGAAAAMADVTAASPTSLSAEAETPPIARSDSSHLLCAELSEVDQARLRRALEGLGDATQSAFRLNFNFRER
jgi:hypothetical protein